MRKTLVCLISCLSSLALTLAQDENSPDTAPVEELPANDTAPGEEGSETEEASPEEEELAALEEAARKGAEEEQLRLAKAATAREAAVGEKHASLTTGKGRSYKKVVIKGVDEVGLKITHEYGTARIKFEELPEEFQARFGYDPSRAQELLTREKDLESARARASGPHPMRATAPLRRKSLEPRALDLRRRWAKGAHHEMKSRPWPPKSRRATACLLRIESEL